MTADGDVIVPLEAEAFGFWLKAAFGDLTTIGTGPWKHEFQSGAWTLPSMSIETGMPEVPRYAMYSGCVIDQLTWQMQRSGLLTATARLVALTPLLVLILGRGPSLTLWVTISVTFFPAFVTLAQGLALVPRSAEDLPRAYGARCWTEMRMVTIPASLPYLFAATRLTVPRVLLRLMIAEWLATGKGLGNLLNQSRGFLDYGMIWAVAAVSVLLSVLFYQAVVIVERRVLRRLERATSE